MINDILRLCALAPVLSGCVSQADMDHRATCLSTVSAVIDASHGYARHNPRYLAIESIDHVEIEQEGYYCRGRGVLKDHRKVPVRFSPAGAEDGTGGAVYTLDF